MEVNQFKLTDIDVGDTSDVDFSVSRHLSICLILLFTVILPLHTQKNKKDVELLRAKIEEAFIKDVIVLSTSEIEAENSIPRHILVRGYTMPSNHFIIRLPVDEWNGKSFVKGCGAGCGTLPSTISGKFKKALQKGYSIATMDTGHWSPNQFEFDWAYNNRRAEIDYAYRAVHETQRTLQEVVNIFYREESKYSYFWGCSGGGRQALMAAVKYPNDFNGIISEAPAASYTDGLMLLTWLRQVNTGEDGKDILKKEDAPLISEAVFNACDSLDGNLDGMIQSPLKCKFNPEVLLCEDDSKCLSQEKVEVLKKWYQGPVNSKGEKLLSSGLALGSEPFWKLWLLGPTDEPFNELLNSENMLRYTAFENDPGESFSVFDFDFDIHPERMKYMANLLNVDHYSLKSFQNTGGKLLMYHGASDPAIPYKFSIEYYKQNYEKFGDKINEFFRLFVIPGMDHCTALTDMGITEDSVDPLTALELWVEEKRAPNNLQVIRFNPNGLVSSKFSVPFYVNHK